MSEVRGRLDLTLSRYGGQPVSMDIADALLPTVETLLTEARLVERRAVVGELREFVDDLYGITGARGIADMLTSALDRIMERCAA